MSTRKTDNEVDHSKHIHEEVEASSTGCGLMGRNPLLAVVSFALLGVGVGIGLSFWEPDEGDDSKDIAIKWIGLVGDLFIRALKAVILPLVFINVSLSALLEGSCSQF